MLLDPKHITIAQFVDDLRNTITDPCMMKYTSSLNSPSLVTTSPGARSAQREQLDVGRGQDVSCKLPEQDNAA